MTDRWCWLVRNKATDSKCSTAKFLIAVSGIFENKQNNSPNTEILNDVHWLENFCFGLTIPPERKRALGKLLIGAGPGQRCAMELCAGAAAI